ncbi:hypothetical protein FRX31_016837 [Thalictrum thalictroides]|uniref:Uncharacterized protein n=1 Tax=Thalictrum thalictroides TaxID=46969 RepID=A0A7J6WBL1_THATH|nr:hypothetical protein FRX31_016837 [Thalictrum thalictroides]
MGELMGKQHKGIIVIINSSKAKESNRTFHLLSRRLLSRVLSHQGVFGILDWRIKRRQITQLIRTSIRSSPKIVRTSFFCHSGPVGLVKFYFND